MRHAVRLPALSGLRLGDLIKLPWTSVGKHAIVWQTGKSRGRRTVVIPIYPALNELLGEIPHGPSNTILNSARRRPWSEAGLESAFRRAKVDATKRRRRPLATSRPLAVFVSCASTICAGRRPPISFWRGSTCTTSPPPWAGQRPRLSRLPIAARYVTAEEIGLAMVEKRRRNVRETESVNRAVNR